MSKKLLLAVVLIFTGCAAKRPYRAMFCEVRRPDGSCLTWASAVPNQECVPTIGMACK